MRIETFGYDDAVDSAVRVEQDFSFGQIEIERIAFVARELYKCIGRIKRFQDRFEQGAGGVVGPTVDRGLRLRVVQFRSQRISTR